MGQVVYPSGETSEAFRLQRERAVQAALNCAREALRPGVDRETSEILLRAVGRYAEQFRRAEDAR